MNDLFQTISPCAYNEIVCKVKEHVGNEAARYILPSVVKALEEGSGQVREEILMEWLNVDSMRVCSYCGDIMEEGWYLECNGYACSDECAAKSEHLSMDEFYKWRIYKDDIMEHLQQVGDSRNINELSTDECNKIIEDIAPHLDYYWTEW